MAGKLHEDFPAAPFTGFRPAAFDFFFALAVNQNKAWMDEHKPVYDTEIKAPLISLITAVQAKLSKKGLVFPTDPARAIFRLNRDVRFSHDKSLYKTNAGAALTRDGVKHSPGVLYLHIDAEHAFAAAGFYHPEPAHIARLRRHMVEDQPGWKKVKAALSKHDLALQQEDRLQRPPKGFDDAPMALQDDLKLKSWVVRREFSRQAVSKPAYADDVAGFALAARPLLEFGWAALD